MIKGHSILSKTQTRSKLTELYSKMEKDSSVGKVADNCPQENKANSMQGLIRKVNPTGRPCWQLRKRGWPHPPLPGHPAEGLKLDRSQSFCRDHRSWPKMGSTHCNAPGSNVSIGTCKIGLHPYLLLKKDTWYWNRLTLEDWGHTWNLGHNSGHSISERI